MAKVLVVDDQEPVRDLIADILMADVHDVRTAENGVEALRLLGEHEYDVILSDMMMPEMDGQQLYDEIARRWPPIVARMVFVTAQAAEPSIADFLGRSGTRVVEKPFRWLNCALRSSTPKGQAPGSGNPQSRPGAQGLKKPRGRPWAGRTAQ